MTGTFPRSFLFVPGNRPSFITSAFRSSADVIVFDLEDAVTPDRKAAARDAGRTASRQIPERSRT